MPRRPDTFQIVSTHMTAAPALTGHHAYQSPSLTDLIARIDTALRARRAR